MKIVAAILAAGASTRFGRLKQLFVLPDGRTLIRHAAEAACASRAERVAVVVGSSAERLSEALSGLALDTVRSPAPNEGIAASVRAATAWAHEHEAEGLVLCVGDQPLLTTSHLDALISNLEQEGGLVASYYDGRAGVPAAFPASSFKALSELSGDEGAAKILRATRNLTLIAWPEGGFDIDTPADASRLRAG